MINATCVDHSAKQPNAFIVVTDAKGQDHTHRHDHASMAVYAQAGVLVVKIITENTEGQAADILTFINPVKYRVSGANK